MQFTFSTFKRSFSVVYIPPGRKKGGMDVGQISHLTSASRQKNKILFAKILLFSLASQNFAYLKKRNEERVK